MIREKMNTAAREKASKLHSKTAELHRHAGKCHVRTEKTRGHLHGHAQHATTQAHAHAHAATSHLKGSVKKMTGWEMGWGG